MEGRYEGSPVVGDGVDKTTWVLVNGCNVNWSRRAVAGILAKSVSCGCWWSSWHNVTQCG